MFSESINTVLEMLGKIHSAKDETGFKIDIESIILLLNQAIGKLPDDSNEKGGLNPIALLLSGTQVNCLKDYCTRNDEQESEFISAAQTLLNESIAQNCPDPNDPNNAAYLHYLKHDECFQCASGDIEDETFNDGRAECRKITCCDCGLEIYNGFE